MLQTCECHDDYVIVYDTSNGTIECPCCEEIERVTEEMEILSECQCRDCREDD